MNALPRLSQTPDWAAVAAAFAARYRAMPDGGSPAIRAHLAKVRAGLDALFAADPEIRPRAAQQQPVTAQFAAALAQAGAGMEDLARALEAVAPALHWEYGYAELPEDLARNYAYFELIGPQGPIVSAELILGFVLFAPGTLYPRHAHTGIEESYLSVSGDWSQNEGGVQVPGSLVFNPPRFEHQITAGAGPVLLG